MGPGVPVAVPEWSPIPTSPSDLGFRSSGDRSGRAIGEGDPPLSARHDHALGQAIKDGGEPGALDPELSRRAADLLANPRPCRAQQIRQTVDLVAQSLKLITGPNVEPVLGVDGGHHLRA